MATFLFRTLLAGLLCVAPAAAQTPRPADQARASLIVGGLGASGAQAGLRLQLAAGWHTYWREPGDAGVPPVFAFDGSTNLAKGTVLFPAPTRMVEEGATIFGYRNDVVFPLQLTPQDPGRPVELDLKVDYAICERVCVPAHARLRATITPGNGATPDAAALADALRYVPAPLTKAEGETLFASAAARAPQPQWTLTWRGPGTAPADLFAEAPDGWYVATGVGPAPGVFVLKASEHPAGARSVDLRLTTRGADGAFTWMQRLDIPSGGG